MYCKVHGISHKGEGVGKIDGKAAFIPFAIPGEEVDVEITESKKKYMRTRLVNILQESEYRINPACKYFDNCGGCAYQHVDYYKQLDFKRQVVIDNVKRIGKLDISVNPVLGMDNPWRYRNKVEWHISNKGLAYYNRDDRSLLPIGSCYLISQEMQDLSNYLNNNPDEWIKAEVTKIGIRQSSLNKKLMLIFYANFSDKIKIESIVKNNTLLDSIYGISSGGKEKLLYGEPVLYEKIGNCTYRVSPQAFFQINHEQTEKLYSLVKRYADLQGKENVLDAYCGTGSISLYVSDQAGKVVGVESFRAAVKDARKNAIANKINNCEFIHGDCEKIIPEIKEKFDLLILDPPRSGCKAELIHAISKMNPSRIVYVSCNPSTMARDLALFNEASFCPVEIQPIDMFPQTGHVECVVVIERK